DCRPFLDGSQESCSLVVPEGVGTAFIMVRGFTTAEFELSVSYAPAGPDNQVTETLNGEVGRREQRILGPFAVEPGTPAIAEMRGRGDPDLYVRFGRAPTLSGYDCRPYRSGPNESCELTVPPGEDEMYVLIYGYSSGTYQLDLTYVRP
ncbi:MAG: PPC domain-containing protein, partial [Myxococcota bacterium]